MQFLHWPVLAIVWGLKCFGRVSVRSYLDLSFGVISVVEVLDSVYLEVK